MANVTIAQQTFQDGTLIAPLTPEIAIYDTTGKLLSNKIVDIDRNKGNVISISKWRSSTTTTLTLNADEIGYDAVANKLYIGTSGDTKKRLTLKATNLYCYEGDFYKYNSSSQKLEYVDNTTQLATMGDVDTFSSTASYTKGDLVRRDGVIYHCIKDSCGSWTRTQDNFEPYVMKEELESTKTKTNDLADILVNIGVGGGNFETLLAETLAKKYEGQQVMVVKYKKDETPSIANWTAELTKEYGDYDVWSLTNSGTTVIDYRMWKNDQNLIGVLYMPITSKVKYLSFNNCQNLVEVMSSAWDTSGLITLETVFTSCKSLTYLDVSNWDISNVTTLFYTFRNCSSLTSLDVSNWNTSNVTTLYSTFGGCSSLASLDVSRWDTSKVTTMTYTFNGCSSLTSLDVSNWNTSNVTILYSTFGSCSSLTSLDVSNWNTSNVTTLYSTFGSCSSLTTLDVSRWDTSKATTIEWMFSKCSSLTTLDVSRWDTSKVATTTHAFSYCTSLTTLDLSTWNISNMKRIDWMFYGCTGLKSLNVSTWNTSNVTMLYCTFSKCSSLTTLDVSRWDTSNVTTMYWTFYGCSSLTSLDLSNWNTAKVADNNSTVSTFSECSKLTTLTVSKNFFCTAKQIDISQLAALTRASFGNFVNNAKTAADEGIAGKGDGTVTEVKEIKLSSTQKAWTTECAVLTSAGYTII